MFNNVNNVTFTIPSLIIYLKLLVCYLGLVIPVNQFGVHTCLVHPLTHVMILEIPVHQTSCNHYEDNTVTYSELLHCYIKPS